MVKIIDQDFLSLLNGIGLKLKTKATSQRMGKRRANQKGSSVEFSDYRRYIPGDDYRRIDWNALARFEKLFIKEYMEEREVPMTLIVDYSQSMIEDAKKNGAIKAAALFAFTALKSYDSVQYYSLASGGQTRYKKIRGGASFYALAEHMESVDFGEDIDLNKSINIVMQTMSKGNTVIISDFLYDHQLDDVLSKLSFKKQHVILVHILSGDELSPSFVDNIRFKDSEDGTELDVDINDSTLKLYEARLNEYLQNIKAVANKYDASYFLINAEQGIDELLSGLSK